MNSFNEKCYKILRKVPKGKVTTYGEIARKLNSKAYRAVGNAMNKNLGPQGHPGPSPGWGVFLRKTYTSSIN